MSKMKISDLPLNTRTMHESQAKWRTKVWHETLKERGSEIEELLEKVNLFDIWSNRLQKHKPAVKLIPEIFMDGYVSIHFAGWGLYKYANACLRSQLETTLRLIYFSTHHIEFDWWCDDNEWYKTSLNKDIWGEGYQYFRNLQLVKEFEKECRKDQGLFENGKKLSGLYSKLSKYVHSGIYSLQTRSDQFSPQYKISEFKMWAANLREVQRYINVLLILGFTEEFKEMNAHDQQSVLSIGIESPHYRDQLRKVIGL